jgi:hypothetical protein
MRSGDSLNKVQLINGLLFLFIGIAIYSLVRGYTLTDLPEAWMVHGLLPYGITQLTHQLPTFKHLIAFSLFIAALLGGRRRSAALVYLFWLFVETVFQVEQLPIVSGWQIPQVAHWEKNFWLLNCASDYFLSGTFDALDIVVAVVAVLLGYRLTNITQARRALFKSNLSQIIAIKIKRNPS